MFPQASHSTASWIMIRIGTNTVVKELCLPTQNPHARLSQGPNTHNDININKDEICYLEWAI